MIAIKILVNPIKFILVHVLTYRSISFQQVRMVTAIACVKFLTAFQPAESFRMAKLSSNISHLLNKNMATRLSTKRSFSDILSNNKHPNDNLIFRSASNGDR